MATHPNTFLRAGQNFLGIGNLVHPKFFSHLGPHLRRIAVYNEDGYVVELLTNNFSWAASTIAQLYKSRWMIEIFFRNLKQNLHIKSFVGTSRNAVEIQIWTALITMLLMSYLRQTAKYDWHFSNLVSSLRLNTFTKIDLQNGWMSHFRRLRMSLKPTWGYPHFLCLWYNRRID